MTRRSRKSLRCRWNCWRRRIWPIRRRFLFRGGMLPARASKFGRHVAVLAVYGGGRCLPALGLYASRGGDDPANCDAQWTELWARFMPGSGLERTGRRDDDRLAAQTAHFPDSILLRRLRTGTAGSVQVWKRALENQSEALARYRSALALGGTRSLPELYAAAGARFAFDTATVGDAINLIERTLTDLEAV